jgi:hypothetical protein
MPLPYLLMKKTFRSRTIATSESFLQQKMPEFQAANPQLRGKTLLETFMYGQHPNKRGKLTKNNPECLPEYNTQPTLERHLSQNEKTPRPWRCSATGELIFTMGNRLEKHSHGRLTWHRLSGSHRGRQQRDCRLHPVRWAFMEMPSSLDHGLGRAFFTLYSHLSPPSRVKSTQLSPGESVNRKSGLFGAWLEAIICTLE